jgi:hypothetical protein
MSEERDKVVADRNPEDVDHARENDRQSQMVWTVEIQITLK